MKHKETLHRIIFGTDTPAGRAFDVVLLVCILCSILVFMLDSVPAIQAEAGPLLNNLEWSFTIVFSLEYLLRLYVSPKPLRYVFSFWGVVDLFALLPAYLSLVLASSHYLGVVRSLRLLRVFRILKLARYLTESQSMFKALRASAYKIMLFMSGVLVLVILLGTIMYVVEGPEHGFDSIPKSIYWAIITITTVGYGDMVPVTPLGKTLASFIMLIGYSILAVPTGIVSAEMTKQNRRQEAPRFCSACKTKLPLNASFCPACGKATS
jgi:voltage-gated potassium channel